ASTPAAGARPSGPSPTVTPGTGAGGIEPPAPSDPGVVKILWKQYQDADPAEKQARLKQYMEAKAAMTR
ncbi:MAG: hypothetical protein AAF492_24485, partial [Verrucomicrobiota bacterium]